MPEPKESDREPMNLRISVAITCFLLGLMIWVTWHKNGLPITEWLYGFGIGLCFAPRFMKNE